MSTISRPAETAVGRALRAVAEAQRLLADAIDAVATDVDERARMDRALQTCAAPADERLLTVEQAAERLGMSVSHVYREAEEGRLTRIKLGAAVRIPEYALTQYVEERRIDARVAGFAAGVRRRRRARHVGSPDTSRPNV
jgi:excisionase family DNA binding protein